MGKNIYEYSEESNMCVIRQDNYCSTLKHFSDMFAEAKKDFPGLDMADVEVERYGGDRHKYQFGIEFQPTDAVPDRYEAIHQLELTG